MTYLVAIDHKGLFDRNKYHDLMFKLVNADSVEEAKTSSVAEYAHCLDVVYFPVAIYEIGNKVWDSGIY